MTAEEEDAVFVTVIGFIVGIVFVIGSQILLSHYYDHQAHLRLLDACQRGVQPACVRLHIVKKKEPTDDKRNEETH